MAMLIVLECLPFFLINSYKLFFEIFETYRLILILKSRKKAVSLLLIHMISYEIYIILTEKNYKLQITAKNVPKDFC